MRATNRVLACFLVALPVVVLTGCQRGTPTYKVEGRVIYRNEPVPFGTVSLVPDSGPLSGAAIGSGGRFALQAVPGKHRVTITAVQPPPVGVSLSESGYMPPPSLIPEKYSRLATSELTVDVEAKDCNRVELDLK